MMLRKNCCWRHELECSRGVPAPELEGGQPLGLPRMFKSSRFGLVQSVAKQAWSAHDALWKVHWGKSRPDLLGMKDKAATLWGREKHVPFPHNFFNC